MHYGGQHRVYGNGQRACVCECKKCWTKEGCARKGNRNGMCLLLKQVGTCKKRANVFANVSAGIDGKA